MVKAAVADGVTAIVTTPHVLPAIKPFDWNKYRYHLDDIRGYCARFHPHLRLYTGCEIFYTKLAVEHLRQSKIITLANTRHVLVEFSTSIYFEDLSENCRELVQAGYLPVIAHTERLSCLTSSPRRVDELKEMIPVSIQVNASYVIKNKGLFKSRYFRHLIKHQLLDFIASDAYNVSTRKVNLAEAMNIMREQYPDYRLQNLLA